MTAGEITLLIFSGLIVGFINTLAGGGSIISLSVLMFLGLPANIANGTNRIALLIQNIGAVGNFKREKVLDSGKGIKLAIPATLGSVIGAFIAVDIDRQAIETAIGIVMIVMMFVILYKPAQWLKGKKELIDRNVSFAQTILYFFIGIYAGFLHMGVGYALLAALVLGSGYDLVKANAVKVLIILIWTPVDLMIFIFHGQVRFDYGLTLAIGNLAGALIASRMAVKRGAGFVRWIIIGVIVVTALEMLGILHIRELLS